MLSARLTVTGVDATVVGERTGAADAHTEDVAEFAGLAVGETVVDRVDLTEDARRDRFESHVLGTVELLGDLQFGRVGNLAPVVGADADDLLTARDVSGEKVHTGFELGKFGAVFVGGQVADLVLVAVTDEHAFACGNEVVALGARVAVPVGAVRGCGGNGGAVTVVGDGPCAGASGEDAFVGGDVLVAAGAGPCEEVAAGRSGSGRRRCHSYTILQQSRLVK